jgi:hypothetical protein
MESPSHSTLEISGGPLTARQQWASSTGHVLNVDGGFGATGLNVSLDAQPA